MVTWYLVTMVVLNFQERSILPFDAVENGGGIGSWGACSDDIFEDDDGNTILDTVSTIIFPQ